MTLKSVPYIEIDDQKGALYSAGKQSLLIPVTFIKVINSIFVQLVGEEGAEILIYKIGEALGMGYVQSLEAILKKEKVEFDRETKLKASCDAIFMEAGWGRVKIREIDLAKKVLEVEITYSPSGEFLENNRYGLERGVLTGIYKEILKEEVYSQLIKENRKDYSVILRTFEKVPEKVRERERLVLLTRKELGEKIKETTAELQEKKTELEEWSKTLEKKVEERTKQLTDAQEQLIQSAKMATIGTLAGGVAHEINNPLGSILMDTQRLLKKTEDKKQREILSRIENSTRRCKEITQALLKYSRKPEMDEFKSIDLEAVIEDSINLLRPHLSKENVKIETKYGEVPPIKGNANELQQVFTNLILNAKDAIRKNKESGVIAIKVFKENRFIVSQVIDNGIGIPEDDLKRIFDPFFTTKEVGQGTGLGLSIAYKIIEKHKGDIYASSDFGEGTKLTIRLPIGKNE